MNPALHYAEALGKDLMALAASASFLNVHGTWSITKWDASVLGPQPSADDLAAVLALPEPAPNLASLAATLCAAAASACEAISAQVVPDATHQTAYANAATIVWASGGQAPSADPAKSVFAAQAAALKLTVPQFVSVVQAVSLVGLELATALSTLRGAAASAKAASDLAAALTAFESSLAAIIASLQSAGLTVAITAPAPITIPGINA